MPRLNINSLRTLVPPQNSHVYPFLIVTATAVLLRPHSPFSFLLPITALLIQLPLYHHLTNRPIHNLPTSFLRQVYITTAFQILLVGLLVPQIFAWLIVKIFMDTASSDPVSFIVKASLAFDRTVSAFVNWLNDSESDQRTSVPQVIYSVVMYLWKNDFFRLGEVIRDVPDELLEEFKYFTESASFLQKATSSAQTAFVRIVTNILARVFRKIGFFSVILTEITKAVMFNKFIILYQSHHGPPYRTSDILVISSLVAVAIANVQVARSSHWATHISPLWNRRMAIGNAQIGSQPHWTTHIDLNFCTCIIAALCTYATSLISCTILALRIARKIVFRRNLSMWGVRVLSLMVCFFFDLLITLSVSISLSEDIQWRVCGTLVAIVLSCGLFVWLRVFQVAADEDVLRKQELQRQQQVERIMRHTPQQ